MSIAIGGGGGLTLITTQSVRATVYDPVTRGNTEFDGRLFYEILPDVYSLLADYDLLPRIWEGYSEAMCDLLLSLICADSSRSLLDVALDYQHKYQHIDFWFEQMMVNDPLPEYAGRGSLNFPYASSSQALAATWRTKLASDRAGFELRSDFDQRATTRWWWIADYSQLDAGSYGFVGYYNSTATAIENSFMVGVGRGGRIAVLQVAPNGSPNMVETSAVVPLDTKVLFQVEYRGSDNTVELTAVDATDGTVYLSGFSYSLLSGPSSEEFSVDRFGLVNLDITETDFSVVVGFNPVKEQAVVGNVYYLGYLDPTMGTDVQAVPALQDSWVDPVVFWEDTENYEYHEYFFAFEEQPEDFLLAEYVSYNRELIKNSFGLNVNFDGPNTATYKSQVQALHSVYWKGPTVLGIQLGTQVLLGLPFSEEAGEVLSVNPAKTGDTGEIVVSGKNGKRAYEYPNSVDAAVVVGETVTQFYPLTEGVEVKDWKNDPSWFRPFLGDVHTPTTDVFTEALRFYETAPVPVNEAQKYHMFMVSVHESLFSSGQLASLLDFFSSIKQTWKGIVFSIFADPSDDVSPEDSVEINLTAPVWDHGGGSHIYAPKYGAPGGPPYDYAYGGTSPAIQYGMFHPSFPDDPLEVRLTNQDVVPHTITVNGSPVTVDPGNTHVESIP